MMEVIEGLAGIICMMDYILVFGAMQEEHNRSLQAALEQLEKADITLN